MRAEVAATRIRMDEMKLSHAELTQVQPAVAPVTCDLNNNEAFCPRWRGLFLMEVMMRRFRFARVSGGIGAAILAMAVTFAPASAARERRCTVGDAQAMFQVMPVPPTVMRPRGQDHPGLLDAFDHCQYHVFLDGETFTFHESDHFLGGIGWFWDYKNAGISRAAAIADIELTEDRVWIAEVHADGTIGERVEQTLMRTAYKNVNSAFSGLEVYQHRAFITQLPPGEYLSYWESTYPGLPTLTATVKLVILPD